MNKEQLVSRLREICENVSDLAEKAESFFGEMIDSSLYIQLKNDSTLSLCWGCDASYVCVEFGLDDLDHMGYPTETWSNGVLKSTTVKTRNDIEKLISIVCRREVVET